MRYLRPGPLGSTLLKVLFLGLLDAGAVYFSVLLAWEGSWAALVLVVAGAAGVTYLALSQRAYPLRYLAPGLFFLVLMVVIPVAYNVYISFTNYSTGHILTKDQVIKVLTDKEYQPSPPIRYHFYGFGTEEALYGVLILIDSEPLFLRPDGELEPLTEHEVVDVDGDGVADKVDGYPRLGTRELLAHYQVLQGLRVPWKGGWLRLASLTQFGYFLPRYRYDPERDAIVDQRTGKVYFAGPDRFVAEDGEGLDPGWPRWVGLANYLRFIRDPLYHGAFGRVFLWNVEWAVLTVVLSFALGLALAVLLNDRKLKLRKLYRSLLIVPYALPAFISVLIWKGFFNTEVGLFNQLLGSHFGIRVPWLTDVFWARFSLILTNVWLTYPYMMLVSLGALQSIPGELYEAAAIDGASPWRRFTRITFPLLMISIAPLLIGSFAFTFNNFTIIWLMTQGNPVVKIGGRAGGTDILLSYAYKLAFQGARGNEYAMAAALGVIIFLIVALISGISFLRTRALEEVSRGL
ncbi:hypothetical protein DRJ54_01750 [Candidatus Acetothermia bacterium]|nr:MAG: hypothetical protein DRJ54_01750 [Candidatus Acetothermia bacterium]